MEVMRILHLGIAILSLFLVFVSVVRADDVDPKIDQILDDTSDVVRIDLEPTTTDAEVKSAPVEAVPLDAN